MGTSASTASDSCGAVSALPLHPNSFPHHPSNTSPQSSFSLGQPEEHHSPPALGNPVDGYKWRKYGQKSVKGSEFPRSYYKCTFPGCKVKKYVEKNDENGRIVDKVSYKGGEHTHDPSRITRINALDQLTFKKSVLTESANVVVRDDSFSRGLIPQHSDVFIKPDESSKLDELDETLSSGETFPTTPRLVVETSADVDHLDDGYNWRKYGQKVVRGSPSSPEIPRSYYQCTEEDCPVKKQVEQRGNSIFNTYEGTHNHLAPGLEEGLVSFFHFSHLQKRKKRKLSAGRISLERPESISPNVPDVSLLLTPDPSDRSSIPLQEIPPD